MELATFTLSYYWARVRRHKGTFFAALIGIPLTSLCVDTLLPLFISQAIGNVASAKDPLQPIIFACIAASIGIVANIIGFQALIHHESAVNRELVEETLENVLHKDQQFFTGQKIGALTTNFIHFIESHIRIQDLLIIRTLGFAISIIVGTAILFTQMWQLGVGVIIAVIILVIEVRWSTKARAQWRKARRSKRAEIHGDIADAISNYNVVKTFAGEQREVDNIKHLNVGYRHVYMKDLSFFGYEGSARIALMSIVQLTVLSGSVYAVMRGQMPIATAVFVLTFLQRIASQVFAMAEMVNGYDQALLDASQLAEVLKKPSIVNDKTGARNINVVNPIVAFNDVSYKYPDSNEEILQRASLTIPAGQKVGLVGASGAGKTTITHLLLRFMDVTGGTITIDGQDIANVTQNSLRKAISYVPQEPALFHRTLRENIAYGKPNASDEEIIAAAKHANAWEFIKKQPRQLDTIVGERGVKLSGGQRQRIAIARALLKDAPILILDEATSALDSESEKLIQDALGDLMQGRTSLVIAHRLSTLAKLDRIIVLNDGEIIEDGSHTELIANDNLYAQLWKRQSGGFIEE